MQLSGLKKISSLQKLLKILFIISVMDNTDNSKQKRAELAVFMFLAVLLAPILAVTGIGSYGLLIWLKDLFL